MTSPVRNIAAPVAALMLLAVTTGLHAQTPLLPTWVHTWSFGQDPMPWLFAPPSQDNHVVVDPVTGLVHCTISDETGLFSRWDELLYTFDPSGAELTSTPPPIVGEVPEAYFGASTVNRHATFKLDVHGGNFIAAHAFFLPQASDWASYASFGTVGGVHGTASLQLPTFSPTAFQVAFGDGGHVLSSATDLVGLDPDGWPTWRVNTGTWAKDIHVKDGTVWALLGDGQLKRIDLATGAELPGNALSIAGQRILVWQDHFFGVEGQFNGTADITAYDGQGEVVYTTHVVLGSNGVVTDAALDSLGRVWIAYTEMDLDGVLINGVLAGIRADGIWLGNWTYGASMNSIACDGTQLYVTGKADAESPDTYLLAANVGFFTDIASAEGLAAPSIRVWPNPARNELHITASGDLQEIDLLDATGRVARSRGPADGLPAGVLDVSGLAPGHYLLRTRQTSGVSTVPVILQ